MEKVTTVKGKAIPLNRADVDTDQIIPAQYLNLVPTVKSMEGSRSMSTSFPGCGSDNDDHIRNCLTPVYSDNSKP